MNRYSFKKLFKAFVKHPLAFVILMPQLKAADVEYIHANNDWVICFKVWQDGLKKIADYPDVKMFEEELMFTRDRLTVLEERKRSLAQHHDSILAAIGLTRTPDMWELEH